MAIATSTAIALALAAASAGAEYYNTENTAHKQDNQAAFAIQQGAQKQKQADAQVNKLVDTQAKSDTKDSAAQGLGQYVQAMQAQKGNTTAGLNQAGNVSDAYKQSGADAALGIQDYGNKIAGLMSRMDAPAMQRQKEAITQNRYSTAIDSILRANAGDQFINDMKLRGIHRNAGIDAGASFANGVAGGLAGGAGGGGYGGVSQETLPNYNVQATGAQLPLYQPAALKYQW